MRERGKQPAEQEERNRFAARPDPSRSQRFLSSTTTRARAKQSIAPRHLLPPSSATLPLARPLESRPRAPSAQADPLPPPPRRRLLGCVVARRCRRLEACGLRRGARKVAARRLRGPSGRVARVDEVLPLVVSSKCCRAARGLAGLSGVLVVLEEAVRARRRGERGRGVGKGRPLSELALGEAGLAAVELEEGFTARARRREVQGVSVRTSGCAVRALRGRTRGR